MQMWISLCSTMDSSRLRFLSKKEFHFSREFQERVVYLIRIWKTVNAGRNIYASEWRSFQKYFEIPPNPSTHTSLLPTPPPTLAVTKKKKSKITFQIASIINVYARTDVGSFPRRATVTPKSLESSSQLSHPGDEFEYAFFSRSNSSCLNPQKINLVSSVHRMNVTLWLYNRVYGL